MPTMTVPFDLSKLMRTYRVTIRELAARTGLTMKDIRSIRIRDRVAYTTCCDLTEAVTGRCVFSRSRYDAMQGTCR